jgi:hypothetical protein
MGFRISMVLTTPPVRSEDRRRLEWSVGWVRFGTYGLVFVLPPSDVAAAEAFCRSRNSPETADRMRVEVELERSGLVLVERHAPWGDGVDWSRSEIARFRWTASRGQWTLQVPGDGGWKRYDGIGPTSAITPLLAEVERDPHFVFWG